MYFGAVLFLYPLNNRIEIIKYIDWEDVEEPCKGDTPA